MATAAQREHIKIMKSDHPAAAVVNAFFEMRESCKACRRVPRRHACGSAGLQMGIRNGGQGLFTAGPRLRP
jgi:hypothetical protein